MATVFTMTARMCTIATVCVALLCLLLFLIGMQVGRRFDARATVAAEPAAAGPAVGAGGTLPAAAPPASAGAGTR
ncbi:MAG: hypothetical protein ACRYHA_20305 [Janthinobacterium lividum]